MYKKISDYGVIGNLCTVALVGIDGAIDWLCLPYLDSPSVFGTLLDERKGGRFVLSPMGPWDSAQEYLPDTNILCTRFRTRDGILRLLDFMPIAADDPGPEKPPELYRLAEVEHGSVELRLVFEPRFDYARAAASVETGTCSILAEIGREAVTPSFSQEWHEVEVTQERVVAVWRLTTGEALRFHLHYGRGELCELDPPENLEQELTFAAQTFVNSGGAVLARENRLISLSQVFKWYARDFGATQADRLRFIAPFFYQDQDRAFLEDQADNLKISYLKYDWRLNRG